MGNDNAIYGIPYRACGVLRIDSVTETATIIGPNYGIGKYFWHGGVKCQSNGKIYGTYVCCYIDISRTWYYSTTCQISFMFILVFLCCASLFVLRIRF